MLDGVFIHYLIKELKTIENQRINKLGSITSSEFFLTLSSKKTLLISVNSNALNVRLTSMNFVNSTQRNNFHMTLKKYLESAIINEIYQYENDRIIILNITHYDELGYEMKLKLIIELFGRNSNIILVNENNMIIDCYKRCLEDINVSSENRNIFPKADYNFPNNSQINPFKENNGTSFNMYQGVSKLLFGEIEDKNNLAVINNSLKPVLIKGNKTYFYCFDLEYLEGERIYFNTLSELLEYYYMNVKKEKFDNNEQLFLTNYINKEITKINNKILKQKQELTNANEDLQYERIGNLLLSNIHLCKKGDNEIIVEDYYNNNEKVIIVLNPLLTANQNAEMFFKKYQKAKRAILLIKEQIEKSSAELEYYKCLINQLNISKINDIMEIYDELNIKSTNQKRPKKAKPNITTYITPNNDYIFVGKNNIQNNYLTNHFARKDDFFFHVQNIPGSHVILRTDKLTDELIYLTGCIASYYSSYRNSTNVCVDYTLIKNVKKIPAQKGSFVTYKNQKSVFGKPDLEFINKSTKCTN